ncbi:MAG: arginine repressor [Lactovum sp.]
MKKSERLSLLKSLIENAEIKRQDDLVELFKDRGFEVTQATISRDIKELGFTKVITENGNHRYILSDKKSSQSLLVSKKYIKSIARQGNFLSLNVLPGTSMHVKNDLSVRFKVWIFSIMTDDNSILIITRSEDDAIKFYNELKGVNNPHA